MARSLVLFVQLLPGRNDFSAKPAGASLSIYYADSSMVYEQRMIGGRWHAAGNEQQDSSRGRLPCWRPIHDDQNIALLASCKPAKDRRLVLSGADIRSLQEDHRCQCLRP